jgi:hypothetical protein
VQTIAGLKALIAAEANCAQSTSACLYNTMPFHDYSLQGVFVVSEQHLDFDNKARNDAGVSTAQKALFLADHADAAANEGIELIAAHYFTLPALTAGDTVDVTGSLRANFGNTYFRVLTITKTTTGAPATINPVAVTAAQAGNTARGAEGRVGGCSISVLENSPEGEAYEGALVEVTLDDGGVALLAHYDTDGGALHRLSLENEVMVGDNFGVLGPLQSDGGVIPGTRVTRLRGFSYYSFGCRKIQPRTVDDITFAP